MDAPDDADDRTVVSRPRLRREVAPGAHVPEPGLPAAPSGVSSRSGDLRYRARPAPEGGLTHPSPSPVSALRETDLRADAEWTQQRRTTLSVVVSAAVLTSIVSALGIVVLLVLG